MKGAWPSIWSGAQLASDAEVSAGLFRANRLQASDEWVTQYRAANKKFKALLQALGDLTPTGITEEALAKAYGANLGDALRYLAGPPISDDDLRVIADVESIAPGVLAQRPAELRKVCAVVMRIVDPFRFPWIKDGKAPTPRQLEAALLASSVLLASQGIATKRRKDGKDEQEQKVKDHLLAMGFTQSKSTDIDTLVKGPKAMQFCGECLLGERKADVVVRLHDSRLMPIECKVSNSATNSVKRLNNDAAVKAGYWLKAFGTQQIVPAAMLSGVFKVMNLKQAQTRGLALFWSHDLAQLGAFIESTR